MRSIAIIDDALGRVAELIPAVLDGLDADDLTWRVDPDANPIGWLIWHLCRVTDDHLATIGDVDQVWLAGGWHDEFDLPYPLTALGFGQSSADVAAFTVPGPKPLIGYAEAVFGQCHTIITGLKASDLDRIIDRRWNPPVTVASRLVSVMVETAQHIGQAGYLRGLRERATGTDSGWKGYPA